MMGAIFRHGEDLSKNGTFGGLTMSNRSLRARLISGGVLVGILVAAIACGEKEVVVTQVVEKSVEKIVQQTVVVEKEKVVEKPVEKVVQQTVVVEKEKIVERPVEKVVTQVVVATPTPAPIVKAPAGPTGKLVVSVSDVGPRVYEMFELVWPYSERNHQLGIYESLLDFDGAVMSPLIAKSWTVDEKGVTFKIRTDVPYHDAKWGKVTAEDVVFSYQRTGAEGTKHTIGQVLQQAYESFQVVDAETVYMKFKRPDVQWASPHRLSGNPVLIQSKKLFDEKGASVAALTANGTGPFRVVDHITDDVIKLEAVGNHWRAIPRVKNVDVLETPEEASRIAALRTGEADIVLIGLPSIAEVQKINGVKLVLGKALGKDGANVYLAGQYYSKQKDDGTQALGKLDTSLPWNGDPNDAASTERARKVRLAMSMAVDRQAIIDAILGGRGCPSYVFSTDSCSPYWNAKWKIAFSPDQAKKLLAEAGYANGFSFKFFIPTGVSPTREEIGEAMVPMWEKIGLKVNIEKAAYSARRPTMLERTIKDAWIFGHVDATLPETYVSMMNYFTTRRVWNPGYEYDKAREFEDRLAPVVDDAAQRKVIGEWMDWLSQLTPDIQVASFQVPWAVGPKVSSWAPVIHAQRWPTNQELVTLK